MIPLAQFNLNFTKMNGTKLKKNDAAVKWLLAERTHRLREQLAEAVGSREVAGSCEAGERAAIEQNIGLACGLELKLSLAAVDVANAARAVLPLKNARRPSLDGHRGARRCLPCVRSPLDELRRGILRRRRVRLRLPRQSSTRPASIRKARTWHSPQVHAKRLCRVTWKTTACRRPARRTRTGAREASRVDGGQIPCGNAREILYDFVHAVLLIYMLSTRCVVRARCLLRQPCTKRTHSSWSIVIGAESNVLSFGPSARRIGFAFRATPHQSSRS